MLDLTGEPSSSNLYIMITISCSHLEALETCLLFNLVLFLIYFHPGHDN